MTTEPLDSKRCQENIAILARAPAHVVTEVLAQAQENGDINLITLCHRELISRRSEDKHS